MASPSNIVWEGLIDSAKPSWARSARMLACSLVRRAFVIMQPMVVFWFFSSRLPDENTFKESR